MAILTRGITAGFRGTEDAGVSAARDEVTRLIRWRNGCRICGSMTAPRWIDRSHPRKWICVLPEQFTFEEFSQEFSSAIDELRRLPSDHRVVVLTDMEHMSHSEARRRQRSAQFIKENKAVFRRHIVAWGFVSTKGVIRGALTAIGWLRAFPVPMKVFTTRRECDAWLDERLAADTAGSVIPTSADDD